MTAIMNTTFQKTDPVKLLLAKKEAELDAEMMAVLNPKKVQKIENLPEEMLDNVAEWAQSEGVDRIREKLRKKGLL